MKKLSACVGLLVCGFCAFAAAKNVGSQSAATSLAQPAGPAAARTKCSAEGRLSNIELRGPEDESLSHFKIPSNYFYDGIPSSPTNAIVLYAAYPNFTPACEYESAHPEDKNQSRVVTQITITRGTQTGFTRFLEKQKGQFPRLAKTDYLGTHYSTSQPLYETPNAPSATEFILPSPRIVKSPTAVICRPSLESNIEGSKCQIEQMAYGKFLIVYLVSAENLNNLTNIEDALLTYMNAWSSEHEEKTPQ